MGDFLGHCLALSPSMKRKVKVIVNLHIIIKLYIYKYELFVVM